jgi:hypothetical protein
LDGHASGGISVRYSPCGHWIASVHANGRLIVHPGSLRARLGLACGVLAGRQEFEQVRSLVEDLTDLKMVPVELLGAR